MKTPGFMLSALGLIALCIYLFVSAPPPLQDESQRTRSIPIETVLATVAAENDVVRTLYTKEIVGKGSKVGLRFDEFWRDEGLEAGPLPALFLREAAKSVQKSPVPLGLFLGSDYPISPSNKFEGKQAEVFDEIKAAREARYFYAEDTQQHTAMFPDFAGVQVCVSCHNGHPQTPKNDWVLNDVMGATTWSYPKAAVDYAEFMAILKHVRRGFRAAYTAYLDKVGTFGESPEIGERWPAAGYYLPSVDVFMAEFEQRASATTVRRFIAAGAPPP